MTEMPSIRDDKGKQVTVPLSSMVCPSCETHIINSTDKFCRSCGMRILMICTKCQQAVRPSDKYCPNCGQRRWAIFEMFRYGILHRSPGFTAFTLVAVGTAWVALYFGVKSWFKARHPY